MNKNSDKVSRRDLLKGAAWLAAASALPAGALAEDTEHTHAHHVHTVDTALMRVMDHTLACVKSGELCSQHCIELFKQGDTALAECEDSVQEMLAVCAALTRLAAYNSKHLKELMGVCIGVCEDCEKECRKHADEHAECKACGDACADLVSVCKQYLA